MNPKCALEGCNNAVKKPINMYCSNQCRGIAAHLQADGTDRRQIVAKLWGEGLTLSQIAQRLHVSKNAVVGIHHRMNLPPKPRPVAKGTMDKTASYARRAREVLPKHLQKASHERIALGPEPLPPMHSISWGAIAL